MFPNCPKYLSKKSTSRRSPKKRDFEQNLKRRKLKDSSENEGNNELISLDVPLKNTGSQEVDVPIANLADSSKRTTENVDVPLQSSN